MRMDRKGIEVLTGMIMASIFVGMVVGASVMIGKHISTASDYAVCEESYLMNFAVAKVSDENWSPPFKLLCYTQEITFEKDGIYQESMRTSRHKSVPFEGDDIKKRSALIRKIANKVTEEMYLCQKQFAWGKYFIFSKWQSMGLIDADTTFCFKCADFEFADSFSAEFPGFVGSGVGKLAYSNEKEETVPGKNYTYWSKIREQMTQESYDKWFPSDFVPGKKYEILFTSSYYNVMIWKAIAGAISGGAGGVAVGLGVGSVVTGAIGTAGGFIVGGAVAMFSGEEIYKFNEFIITEDIHEPEICDMMV